MEVLCPNTDLKLNLLRSVLKKNRLVMLDSWYEAEYLRTNKKKQKKKQKKKAKPSVFHINGTVRSLSKFKVIRHLKFLLYASNE